MLISKIRFIFYSEIYCVETFFCKFFVFVDSSNYGKYIRLYWHYIGTQYSQDKDWHSSIENWTCSSMASKSPGLSRGVVVQPQLLFGFGFKNCVFPWKTIPVHLRFVMGNGESLNSLCNTKLRGLRTDRLYLKRYLQGWQTCRKIGSPIFPASVKSRGASPAVGQPDSSEMVWKHVMHSAPFWPPPLPWLACRSVSETGQHRT